jgi:peptide/nickel transport system permease protein
MAGSLGNSGSLGPENPQALRVATPVSSVPAGVRPPRAPADKPVISARALPMVPPVVAFVFKRVAQGALTLLVMSILIFAATNVLPGNVAQTVLGKQATPALIASLDQKLDLNRSLPARYESWLSGAIHGDFGLSAVAVAQNNLGDASVAKMIAVPLRNSAILALLAMLIIVPASLLLGVLAGMRGGSRLDYAISYPALVLGAFPEFVVGLALIAVFFSALALLSPVALVPPGKTPLSHPTALVLPVLTLVLVSIGWTARQVRAGMVEVMRSDYVMMARLAGIPERRVLTRYAMRNAVATSVQALAQTAQYLLGGIIVVEVLFSYPGVGSLLDQAVQTRDTTVVQAVALIVAAAYIAINIAADLAVVLLVPRLRTTVLS